MCKAHLVMKVALDATPLLGVRTGIGYFCEGALRALAGREEVDVCAFAVSWRRRSELTAQLPPGVRSTQRPMPARPLHLAWSHVSGPAVEWFIGPVDVVHGTNYVVPPTRHAARVVSVHDLTPLRFPELCDESTLQFPRLVRRAAESGAWVHTDSRFVAEEVVAELGVEPSRVRAVHPGIPGIFDRDVASTSEGVAAPDATPNGTNRAQLELPSGTTRYVLAVGTVEPRKDYPTLVKAFDVLGEEMGDLALVIAGADGWGAHALDEALESARRRERILRLGYVASDRLGALFEGAAVVAYPSVYEGFGFVPLEAMAAGVPVVATSVGSIPEVVGDGAMLVGSGMVDELADALGTALGDEQVRAALVERGKARAGTFTWEACAAGLTDLYAAALR